MNRNQILIQLAEIADEMETENLYREAIVLTNVMKRVAEQNFSDTNESEGDMPLEEQLKLPPQHGLHPAAWKDSIRAHHDWRLGRGLDNPRDKPTGEIDESGQKVMENINRPYHLLSRKNQLLTSSAIENAYRLIQENPDASLEELASGVHDFWIEENSWQGNPDQPEETRKNFARLSVPYDELPEDEKQKDRNFIVRALKSMEENSN